MEAKQVVETPDSLITNLHASFPEHQFGDVVVQERAASGWAHPFLVAFLPPEDSKVVLGRAFGRAYYSTNVTFVRADLPPRIRSVTEDHEMAHITGWGQIYRDIPYLQPLVNEFSANLYSFLQDPIGFIAAVAFTFTNQERRAFYRDRVKTGDRVGK